MPNEYIKLFKHTFELGLFTVLAVHSRLVGSTPLVKLNKKHQANREKGPIAHSEVSKRKKKKSISFKKCKLGGKCKVSVDRGRMCTSFGISIESDRVRELRAETAEGRALGKVGFPQTK